MKYFGVTRILALVGLLFLVVAQFGCSSPKAAGAAEPMINPESIDTTYHPGDKIAIDFLDTPNFPQNFQQIVREDGTITLPLNQTIVVAGKKKGDVEREIHQLYVPRLLKRLTVNIRAEERTYFVRGEVRQPRQLVHTGAITALKAISAAGDFTDFADRKKIDVIRADGTKIRLNGKDALEDASKDVPVYPGDTVYVHRRFF